MAMSMLAIAGEEAWSFASNLLKLGDGSFIAVSLDKPSYNAGETMCVLIAACRSVSSDAAPAESISDFHSIHESCLVSFVQDGKSRCSDHVTCCVR